MTTKKTLTIEFESGSEGEAQLRRVLNADATHNTLYEISQTIFRPARKHGYSDEAIQSALDKAGKAGVTLVSLLESRFYEILKENRIDIYEDWS